MIRCKKCIKRRGEVVEWQNTLTVKIGLFIESFKASSYITFLKASSKVYSQARTNNEKGKMPVSSLEPGIFIITKMCHLKQFCCNQNMKNTMSNCHFTHISEAARIIKKRENWNAKRSVQSGLYMQRDLHNVDWINWRATEMKCLEKRKIIQLFHSC